MGVLDEARDLVFLVGHHHLCEEGCEGQLTECHARGHALFRALRSDPGERVARARRRSTSEQRPQVREPVGNSVDGVGECHGPIAVYRAGMTAGLDQQGNVRVGSKTRGSGMTAFDPKRTLTCSLLAALVPRRPMGTHHGQAQGQSTIRNGRKPRDRARHSAPRRARWSAHCHRCENNRAAPQAAWDDLYGGQRDSAIQLRGESR